MLNLFCHYKIYTLHFLKKKVVYVTDFHCKKPLLVPVVPSTKQTKYTDMKQNTKATEQKENNTRTLLHPSLIHPATI